ncbi:MAG: aminoacyl-tRNA hydrolase [Chitinophagaceae bacterium]
MDKFLFIGLGNIGQEYIHTRHNIGFDILDFWVKKQNSFWIINRLATTASCTIKGKKIIAIKPNTYMNLSGKAVKYYKEKENIPLANIIIIVDDLHIPLGEIKLRLSGSNGGHNGLKNIEECLQTKQYPRLRCGIGNVFPKGKQVDFVLGKWEIEEKQIVDKMIAQTSDALGQIIFRGVVYAMNSINLR